MTSVGLTNTQVSRYYRLAVVRDLLPESRTAHCMRIVRYNAPGVSVLHNPDTRTARFGNLCTCNSGWICPICAPRLAEKKADLLKQGLLRTPEIHPTLLTFTLSHHKGMTLNNSLDALKAAHRALIQSRNWRSLCADTGLLTMITATEILYSQNGWHTHMHAIALHDRNLDSEDAGVFSYQGAKQWIAQLDKVGYTANMTNGFDVKAARYSVADYVAKFGREPSDIADRSGTWGIEREAVKGVSKVSRSESGKSMQAILMDSQGKARSQSGRLFSEYYSATFGKKILTISKLARDILGLDSVIEDDQALIDSVSTNEQIIAMLTRAQWRVILRDDRRSELLQIAAMGDPDRLRAYLLDVCPELDI